MSTNLNNEETKVIDYLADVKELEDAGVSDDVIAQHLSTRTMQAMPCSDARTILQEAVAVVEDPVAGTRAGSLIDHYSGLPQGDEKSLLGWFISHVFGNGETVSTDSYPRSIQWSSVTAGMGADLQVVAQSLVDATGGQPDAGTTIDDVIASRNAYNVQQAEVARQDTIAALQAEIENTWINPAVTDGVSTAADVRAAIKAGL